MIIKISVFLRYRWMWVIQGFQMCIDVYGLIRWWYNWITNLKCGHFWFTYIVQSYWTRDRFCIRIRGLAVSQFNVVLLLIWPLGAACKIAMHVTVTKFSLKKNMYEIYTSQNIAIFVSFTIFVHNLLYRAAVCGIRSLIHSFSLGDHIWQCTGPTHCTLWHVIWRDDTFHVWVQIFFTFSYFDACDKNTNMRVFWIIPLPQFFWTFE